MSNPPMASINIAERFARISEQWHPKSIAELNDYEVRLAKVEGDFVWHAHPETDELFLVIDGHLTIHLRTPDSAGTVVETAVEVDPGEIYVVPRGTEHKPYAAAETCILMLEPIGTPNTGDAGGDRTREIERLV